MNIFHAYRNGITDITEMKYDSSSNISMTKLDCIFVMGVSGCGKTTVGQKLAETLNAKFTDADDYHSIENRLKMANGY